MKTAPARVPAFIAPSFLIACILLGCPSAVALNPNLDVSQYAHTSWKSRDGFAKGEILAVAQTPDGYLWLGTQFGLFRFDGLKNVPWQPPPGQSLPSSDIRSLLAARDGTLWIGTLKGLASWKDGKLTQYAELAGHAIFGLLEDHEGTGWVGAANVPTGKLCSIQNGSVKCYGEGGSLGRPGVLGLFEDSKGNLWVGVATGLWRWKPGPPKFYPLPGEPNGIRALGEDEDGTLLVGMNGRLQRFVDGKTESYPLPDTLGQFSAKKLLRDRDGGLWIGTQYGGIVHVHQGRTDVFAPSDGLSGEDVHSLFEDREGNIWVATVNGLDRFHEFAVTAFNVNQGLSNAIVAAVLTTRDGSVWMSTSGGLNRWSNGQITVYREHAESTMTGVRKVVASGLPDKATQSLFEDDRGRIWVSTFRGVGYLENDRFVSISGIPGVNTLSISEDTAGNLWVINEPSGLFQLLRGVEVKQIPWAGLGHKDHATTLAVDSSRGGLWLGFHLGGVAYFADGQIRSSYTAADGLGGGRVNNLRFDEDGTLWAATDGGLSRFKDGRVTTLTVQNGLPCDAVHWVMEDDIHTVWLHTECGLLRIARSELDAWAVAVEKDKDAKPAIRVTVFDSSDGTGIISVGSHYSPQVAKSADGRLWFQGLDGVNVVDPRHLPFNKLPPPVHVEQLTADRKAYEATSNGNLSLPPLIRDLQIDYTALSLVAPEKIRFRYKLEGYDSDWHDVGNRRQAFYTNLPPRTYRFRVMAANNSGVWNETGAFLDFTIAPAYYQTNWFLFLVGVLFLLVVGAIYRWRVRQVALQVRGRMEERLEERERIARDLHDTLLQSVQGLILKFHAVANKIQKDDPAHSALQNALDSADQVLAEGRDRIRNLRVDADSLSDLPAAFQAVAKATMQNSDVTLKTIVEGKVRDLHPLVLHESFAIGREGLVNALTHSKGRNVEVEVIYEPRQFRLRVRDDGRGIDPEILQQGGRTDHWGLRGMHERAQKIGAKLEIWSRAETGTELELTVPGATAYAAKESKPRFAGFRPPAAGERDQ